MGKVAVTIIALTLFIALLPSSSTADSVSYFYDDSGRLIKTVSDKGQTVIYSYDAAGNLISVTNQTVNPNLPVIGSITPNTFFPGTTAAVTITGSNLLTAQSVTSDNTGIIISGMQSTDMQVTATFQVSAGAALGQTNVTVKTLYGSASIAIQIAQVSVNPASLCVQIGDSKQISVNVTPLSQTKLNVTVNNPGPDVVGTPQSVSILPGGSGTLTVNGIAEGTVVLDVAGAKCVIFVSAPLTGAFTARSNPVSVLVGPVLSGSVSIGSTPVSVLIGPVLSGGFTSMPVSVQWLAIPNATEDAAPVCVEISHQ